jgi:hypothetical protein
LADPFGVVTGVNTQWTNIGVSSSEKINSLSQGDHALDILHVATTQGGDALHQNNALDEDAEARWFSLAMRRALGEQPWRLLTRSDIAARNESRWKGSGSAKAANGGGRRRQRAIERQYTIARQSESLVRLVDDLREVSRITRGKIDLRKQGVGLNMNRRHDVETPPPSIAACGRRRDFFCRRNGRAGGGAGSARPGVRQFAQ